MSAHQTFDQGNLISNDSQQGLLRYTFNDQTQDAAPGDGDHHQQPMLEMHRLIMEAGHQREGVPEGTQLALSPSPSIISYDSLEERSSQGPHQPQVVVKPDTNRRWLPKTIWMAEIWSCVIASACLAAIIGVLSAYQGHPLPQWPLHITINALIAVFTAIFKTALMVPIAEGISQFKWLWFTRPRELADIERFDRASRGAWGSFLLLASRVPRLNSIWLANLGAIVTIASLAVDPFSQQIIQSRPCLCNVSGAAAQIPKTQNLEPAITTPSVKPRLTGSMQAAIYMGLLSPSSNSSTTITARCQTGNCTFPSDGGATFSTLAMCQSCIDISDTITYNYTSDNGNMDASIPSGASIYSPNVVFESMADSTSFPESVFSFEALMSQGVGNETSGFAIACGMNPCLKTFGANVTDSIYHEIEISSETLIWSYHAGYTLATNITLRNGTWQSCLPTPQNTSTNTLRINTTSMSLISEVRNGTEYSVSANIDLQNISATSSLWYPDDCVWWLGDPPNKAMATYLSDLFDNKTLETPYWSREPSSAQGELWLETLYRNGTANMTTVATYMDGLVWSMTANMRQNSADSDELRVVYGKVQTIQSCIKVLWVWLSLPASLFCLEVAFLVAMMALSRSNKHWHEDWKGSSLALLFHGLHDYPVARGDMKRDMASEGENLTDKAGTMFKLAGEMRVQLRRGKNSWRFYRAE